MTTAEVYCNDTLRWCRLLEDKSIDLSICSPPYGDIRAYGKLKFKLRGQAWVDWAFERFMEQYRITKGATVWVIDAKTKDFAWGGEPMLLYADLQRAGVKFRHPMIYKRNGVFGGGGPDWFRNDFELILCATHGRLPWSDNTAMGHPPKFKPGGNPSHQTRDGRVKSKAYKPPAIANPGNVIDCGAVGGGHMGSKLAHENEAPFPLQIPEFFIRSCCPPGGLVYDGFCGSGTTGHAAILHGRNFVGHDIRQDQVELTARRFSEAIEQVQARARA